MKKGQILPRIRAKARAKLRVGIIWFNYLGEGLLGDEGILGEGWREISIFVAVKLLFSSITGRDIGGIILVLLTLGFTFDILLQ